MNKKNLTLGFVLGLAFANGVFASDPKTEKEELDINSVVYIEEEVEIVLGFDTADYLPENFDPYKTYIDLNAVTYIEESFEIDLGLVQYLPKGFDAYAYPTDAQSINYIDEK